MVYVESENLGLQPLIDCWIRSLSNVSQYFHKNIFAEIFCNDKILMCIINLYTYIFVLNTCNNNFESIYVLIAYLFLTKYSTFFNSEILYVTEIKLLYY